MIDAKEQVQGLCSRMSRNPCWMPDPASWVWKRPDGQKQGFGLGWHLEPGMANLLWLALDKQEPPARYDAATNLLYSQVMMGAYSGQLRGTVLVSAASVLTLQEFEAALPAVAPPRSTVLEMRYPELKRLARKRLGC